MKKNRMMLMAAMLTMAATVTAAAGEPTPGAFPVAASYMAADCARIETGYVRALSADNEGVVESAIALMAHAKLYRPDWCMTRVAKKLEDLAMNGATPAIRYKAYLATMVFANPAAFSAEKAKVYASTDEFYKAVAGRMNTTLLTVNVD